ncbi:MAG: hypothetical protein AB8B97_27550 [Granulosicoccus sp.]
MVINALCVEGCWINVLVNSPGKMSRPPRTTIPWLAVQKHSVDTHRRATRGDDAQIVSPDTPVFIVSCIVAQASKWATLFIAIADRIAPQMPVVRKYYLHFDFKEFLADHQNVG